MTSAIVLAAALGLFGDPDTVKVTFAAENSPLSAVLTELTYLTDVPIELDKAARKKLDPDKLRVSISVKDISVASTLKLLVGAYGAEVKVMDRRKIVITSK